MHPPFHTHKMYDRPEVYLIASRSSVLPCIVGIVNGRTARNSLCTLRDRLSYRKVPRPM